MKTVRCITIIFQGPISSGPSIAGLVTSFGHGAPKSIRKSLIQIVRNYRIKNKLILMGNTIVENVFNELWMVNQMMLPA